MKLKRENNADKHAVFGSIEVLGDITGSGIQTIRKNIDALSKSVSTTAAKQENYWQSLVDDSTISPVEKRTLKQEWNTIEQTYASIIELARENGVEESTEIVNYSLAYNALYSYLTETLKVFDDMGTSTAVPDREVFEEKFEDYYYNQTLAQNKVVVQKNLNVRILDNLDGPGTENEIASYNGMLYMYDTKTAKWKALDTAAYLGTRSASEEFPPPVKDSFFLAVDDTLKTNIIFEDGKILYANGLPLIANAAVTAGNIYICTEEGTWTELTDRDDWRYIVAMNDLLKYEFEVSSQIGTYIETKVSVGIAKYKGPYTSLSQIPVCNNGDWFMWAGEETIWNYSTEYSITLERGQVYKLNKPTWAKLDPTDSRYNNEFMTALVDIVNLQAQGDGYFSTIFVKKIFALEAAIQTLQTKVIELTEGGCIKTQGYTPGAEKTGVYIGADGQFECYEGRFNKGFFSGFLDCELLRITKSNIEYTVINYTSTDEVDNHLYSKFGVEYYYKGNVKEIYGDNIFIYIEGTFYKNIEIHIKNNRISNTFIKAWDDDFNESFFIYSDYSSMVMARYLYYGYYKLVYKKDDETIMDIKNLPTVNPHVKGRAWNDNGNLRISEG